VKADSVEALDPAPLEPVKADSLMKGDFIKMLGSASLEPVKADSVEALDPAPLEPVMVYGSGPFANYCHSGNLISFSAGSTKAEKSFETHDRSILARNYVSEINVRSEKSIHHIASILKSKIESRVDDVADGWMSCMAELNYIFEESRVCPFPVMLQPNQSSKKSIGTLVARNENQPGLSAPIDLMDELIWSEFFDGAEEKDEEKNAGANLSKPKALGFVYPLYSIGEMRLFAYQLCFQRGVFPSSVSMDKFILTEFDRIHGLHQRTQSKTGIRFEALGADDSFILAVIGGMFGSAKMFKNEFIKPSGDWPMFVLADYLDIKEIELEKTLKECCWDYAERRRFVQWGDMKDFGVYMIDGDFAKEVIEYHSPK
jgi:hypothetical protein